MPHGLFHRFHLDNLIPGSDLLSGFFKLVSAQDILNDPDDFSDTFSMNIRLNLFNLTDDHGTCRSKLRDIVDNRKTRCQSICRIHDPGDRIPDLILIQIASQHNDHKISFAVDFDLKHFDSSSFPVSGKPCSILFSDASTCWYS